MSRDPAFQVPPFSVRLLEQTTTLHDPDQLLSFLPASYRDGRGDLIAAAHNIAACVEKELDLARLATVHHWLWIAGLPLPPRALHHQLLLGREIFITEQMDMHLVWTSGRMFLKPIPLFLLEPNFWTEYLSCQPECGCSANTLTECKRRGLYRRALGFLFSYTALLSHESDFRIAQDRHLLRPEITWSAWRIFVEQLDTKYIYPRIDRRFLHGELRLSRLNKIYALYQTPLRGYMARWDRYGAFFHDYFSWLASVTVYIAIVLTAMQVGLATDALAHSPTFQSASYGFTVFSILGPLVASALIILQFCGAFIYNWAEADHWRRTRCVELHVS
ncbi:hypothetical protein CBS147321_6321 [Aspergillus niger]|nr:hypothetical protein CBS133816_2335 [Aspergillus niger]KAI2940182.1 hypothetical protein CBS147321_6321 [Aspergillus niger]KAI2946247.1 hypothetical protein CBS147322_7235 [Aspergillus niger]KAI2979273.1 hypothetical protein CBS147324_824 [Aspergillus niger]KAI2981598.1 hypothetical protein CBS147482_10269 [Aspergillus niger]